MENVFQAGEHWSNRLNFDDEREKFNLNLSLFDKT